MPRPTCSRVAAVAALAVLALSACSTGSAEGPGGSTRTSSRVILVVAAENFWGSIARQLGGAHVHLTTIITSPSADPHDYEPTAADGRVIATADLLVVNGIGYDTWATKLAAANPSSTRTDLTVGSLLDVPDGGNPHRWYNPDDVRRVATALVADCRRIDPADAAYFRARLTGFETTALAAYDQEVRAIRTTYAGTPVGASESIFAMVAPALGLDLVTPPGFLEAVSEGTDPTAADKRAIDAQLADHAIKVYVYNSQNATPDVRTQIAAAKAQGIPVTTITETLTPPTASWEQWQTAQLVRLQAALARATGR